MRLKNLTYSQFPGTPHEWSIQDLALKPLNLIVGKNATGKTRVLNVIHGLAKLVSGEQALTFLSGKYDVLLENAPGLLQYILEYEQARVTREEIVLAGRKLLERGEEGRGKIWAEKLGTQMEIQVSPEQLAAVARRDAIQHPFFDPLHHWGQSVDHYSFGSPLGKETYLVVRSQAPGLVDKDKEKVITVFWRGLTDYGEPFTRTLLEDMSAIGYPLEEIGMAPPARVNLDPLTPVGGPLVGLFVKERELRDITEQSEMSQGMFRTLSVLIHLNYSLFAKRAHSVLVDDIGEGLDYERSCALIQVLMMKAEQSGIQMILSTNDRFTMNMVPLESWTVLSREGGPVKILNYENSRQLFDDFKFTGLSNFDFLASNFFKSEGAK
jgi:hypothetical protein